MGPEAIVRIVAANLQAAGWDYQPFALEHLPDFLVAIFNEVGSPCSGESQWRAVTPTASHELSECLRRGAMGAVIDTLLECLFAILG
jgi:hypothetical protein